MTIQETVQINSGGSGQVIRTPLDDGVTVPRGTYDNWAISKGATQVESNHITRIFKGSVTPTNRVITYSSSKTTMRPGDNGVHTWNFSGYPPNSTLTFTVWANASNFMGGQDYLTLTDTVQINSSGSGTVNWPYVYLGNDILPGGGPVRGWVLDQANNVKSNTVVITYVPPACPANGTKKEEVCEGGNLVGIFHNGNCGTYKQVITYNSPGCGTYNRSINFQASKTYMNPGDKGTYTWTFSGYPPNTTVLFNVWAQAANFMGGADYKTLTDTVQINASGTGVFTWPYDYLGSDILPGGGPVRGWIIDPATNTKSNVLTMTYAASGH